MLSRWPENIRKKILLEKEKIVYPENGNFREKFRLCASERLFLHEALPSEEAVIFLDTDIIFLKSPEILWEEFAFFNSDQLSGLSPSLYLYHRFYKALFKAFLKFDVETPLEELLQTIKTSLKNIDPKIDTSRCSKLSNIDEMLTKSLEKTISLRI
ncbi:Glucoside xylosyltransferase 2 [Armadillidium vulgare]|nr:Glucoside xylosyltransferase 2 [Armadillidium vulgare]